LSTLEDCNDIHEVSRPLVVDWLSFGGHVVGVEYIPAPVSGCCTEHP